MSGDQQSIAGASIAGANILATEYYVDLFARVASVHVSRWWEEIRDLCTTPSYPMTGIHSKKGHIPAGRPVAPVFLNLLSIPFSGWLTSEDRTLLHFEFDLDCVA